MDSSTSSSRAFCAAVFTFIDQFFERLPLLWFKPRYCLENCLDPYMRLGVLLQIKPIRKLLPIGQHSVIRPMDAALTSESALFTTFLKYGNIQALDRGVLTELIDVVLVHEKNTIAVKFRYADEMARITELVEQNREMQHQ